MMAVIFNTETEELLQTVKYRGRQMLPEVACAGIFSQKGLDPLDYSVREMVEDYTSNEFKQFCYIFGGDVHSKEPIFCEVDKKEITADGVDKATISNCPEGVSVYFDNALVGEVGSDGLVEVTSSVPRKLNVRLEKMEYQTERVTINAT